MKQKIYKKHFFYAAAVLSAGLCLFFLTADAGLLSDDKRPEEQNVLGGTGSIKTLTNGYLIITPPFSDDTMLYYRKQFEGPDGRLKNEVYAYDKKTRKEEPVCKREFCEHDTPDCVLYDLYGYSMYSHTIMDYTPLDGYLYYSYRVLDASRNEGEPAEIVHLCRWNIETGQKEEVCTFVGNEWMTDEDGMKINGSFGGPRIGRVNSDTILVQLKETYLFDNQFAQKTVLDFHEPELAWSEDYLVWSDSFDLKAYCISTGQEWSHLLQTAYQKESKLSARSFYVEENRVYCAVEDKIVTFEIGDTKVTELVDYTKFYYFNLIEHCLYYLRDEAVFCLNLATMEEKKMAEMKYVPWGKLEDGKLFTIDTSRDCQIVCYDAEGREVAP